MTNEKASGLIEPENAVIAARMSIRMYLPPMMQSPMVLIADPNITTSLNN